MPPWPTWPALKLPVLQLTQLCSLDLTFLEPQLLAPPAQGVSTRSTALSTRNKGGSSRSGSSRTQTGSSSKGSIARPTTLPQLQKLKLSSCNMTVQTAAQLLSATTLTALHWDSVSLHARSCKGKDLTPKKALATMWHWLQLLPKLSTLRLPISGDDLTAADVAPISTLWSLRDFGATAVGHSSAAAVAACAPTELTALSLQPYSRHGDTNPGAALAEVCLTRLSNLQCFRGEGMDGVCMQPSTLSSMTGLRELRMGKVLHADGSEWSAWEQLAVLQSLTELRRLELEVCTAYWPYVIYDSRIIYFDRPRPEHHGEYDTPQQHANRYQCFSALTASTQLTALVLTSFQDVPVPPAAFEFMFPPGHVLPNLKVLSLCSFLRHYDLVRAADIARIAASCPALHQLKLDGVTVPSFDVSCLLQLPPGVTRVQGLDWVRPSPVGVASWASLPVWGWSSWLGSCAEFLGNLLPKLRR
jgi:hypothetical protein